MRKLAIDRLGALEVQNRRKRARLDAVANIADVAAEADAAFGAADDPEKQRDHLIRNDLRLRQLSRLRQRHIVCGLPHLLVAVGVRLHRRHEHREEAADETSCPRARQIEMTRAIALKERAGAAIRL